MNNKIYELCIPRDVHIKDEYLQGCLKKHFDLAMLQIDNLVKAVRDNSSNVHNEIYDAKVSVAFAMSTALSVGMNVIH